ncbi:hypothetical protein LCM20_12400 [Halobacillus litoralis]|uniref:hypothetical protein n=1 Tax=Halobacillus litoralis TaxID=45668 RepID=UPI001CD356B5|nr:hypothetical protein [Halobacillus litoralis]MCA0971397.1 hypothetical protein [Halobacillus litoralis]
MGWKIARFPAAAQQDVGSFDVATGRGGFLFEHPCSFRFDLAVVRASRRSLAIFHPTSFQQWIQNLASMLFLIHHLYEQLQSHT